MRIGFDATPLLRVPKFGIHHYAYELTNHLFEAFPDDTYLLFFDRELIEREGFDRTLLDRYSAHVQPVPLRTIGPSPTLARQAWFRFHLPLAVKRHKVDIFHGLAHDLPFVRSCPTICAVHDLMPIEYLSWHRSDRNSLRSRRELLNAIHRATAVATVSEATKHAVLEATARRRPARIEVIPNGLRRGFRRIQDRQSVLSALHRYNLVEPYVLTVGFDTPRRNYRRLISAFAQVADTAIRQLVITGNGNWAESRAVQLVRNLGMQERVVFLHGVPDEDLAAVYTAAKAYVCPSLCEGFGLPVLEAMACGTPVICSDIPALREVAGQVATYFNPTDIDSIRSALLTDGGGSTPHPSDASCYSQQVEKFSWIASAHKAHSLYSELFQQ